MPHNHVLCVKTERKDLLNLQSLERLSDVEITLDIETRKEQLHARSRNGCKLITAHHVFTVLEALKPKHERQRETSQWTSAVCPEIVHCTYNHH